MYPLHSSHVVLRSFEVQLTGLRLLSSLICNVKYHSSQQEKVLREPFSEFSPNSETVSHSQSNFNSQMQAMNCSLC